jgi:hypothetical protein
MHFHSNVQSLSVDELVQPTLFSKHFEEFFITDVSILVHINFIDPVLRESEKH